MPDPVWSVPCADLTVDVVNDWAARFVAHHSDDMPDDVKCRNNYFPIFDEATANITVKPVRRSGFNGPINVSSFPWNDSWDPGETDDKQVIIRNYTTKTQRGVWAPLGSSFFFGPSRYLQVGASYLCKSPSGVEFNFETGLSNFKGGTGSGYPPMPPTAAEFTAELIEHWIPVSYNNAFRGVDGYAFSPAGGFEQSGNPEPSPDWNSDIAIPEGVRLGLDPAVCTDPWIEDWLDDKGYTGVTRSRAKTLATAMRDYGIFLQATGPNALVLMADIDDDFPEDLIFGLITVDTLIAYEPPLSTLPGGDTTTLHGWAESIEYTIDTPDPDPDPDPPAEGELVCNLVFTEPLSDGEPWVAVGALTVSELTLEDVTVEISLLSTALGANVSMTGELGTFALISTSPTTLADLAPGSYDFIISGNSNVTGSLGETVQFGLLFTASNAPDDIGFDETDIAPAEEDTVLATLTDTLEILSAEPPVDGGCGTYDHGLYEDEGGTYDALDPECTPVDPGHEEGCGCEACDCEHQGTLEIDIPSPADYARSTLGWGRAELRERLGELAPIAWSNSVLDRFINEGVREVARQTMHLEDVIEFCAEAERSEYQPDELAAAFSVDSVEFQPACDSTRYPVEYRDRRSMDGVWFTSQSQTMGIPEFFTIWGIAPNMKVRFYPTPSDGGTFRVYYWRVPALMVTDDDEMEVPSGWEELVVDFAEYKALRRDRDSARALEAKAMFDERVSYMLRYTSRHTPNTGTFDYQLGGLGNAEWLYGIGIL